MQDDPSQTHPVQLLLPLLPLLVLLVVLLLLLLLLPSMAATACGQSIRSNSPSCCAVKPCATQRWVQSARLSGVSEALQRR